ncbi:MAG: hypothetical protein FJ261_11215 [Planctomycetes bacterium]|nr:hypothetical protein [Planctomycetota bacterium]
MDKMDPKVSVISAWAELAAIAKTSGKPDLLARFQPARERLELGLFRLVVMGEIKKGKSSFINALLGFPGLLPVDSDIATSTVFKVMYGKEKAFRVFFRPDAESGKRPTPLLINPENLNEYGTEGGNPENIKNVDFIGVEVPCPLLANGLVLVDTPGVGGLYKAHRDITWAYAPNADGLLFVLDSVETVISQDEISFLKELTSKITKKVFFVQTKSDAAGSEQSKAWQDRNLDVLSKELGLPRDRIPYFTVSSKLKGVADKRNSLKHLTESGFPAIQGFIQNQLVKEKQKLLSQSLGRQLLAGAHSLRDDIAERRKIIVAAQQSGLEAIRKQYEDARSAFDKWSRVECPSEVKSFNQSFGDLKRGTLNKIVDELDPEGPMIISAIRNIRASELSPEQISEKAREIQNDSLVSICEFVNSTHQQFNKSATKIIEAAIARIGNGLAKTSINPESEFSIQQTQEQLKGIHLPDDLPTHFSTLDRTRDILMGGTLGYSIATTGIILTSALFPPLAAVAGIASILGIVVGAIKQSSDSSVRKKEEILAKLKGLLQSLMRKAQKAARDQLETICTKLERSTEQEIQTAMGAYRSHLEAKMQEISAAKNKTAAECKADVDSLAIQESKITAVLAKLNSIIKPAGATAP